MKVDQERTRLARLRHKAGTARLLELFKADPANVGTPPDQRWLSNATRVDRRAYRRYRAQTDPRWVSRRRKRKSARRARKLSRS